MHPTDRQPAASQPAANQDAASQPAARWLEVYPLRCEDGATAMAVDEWLLERAAASGRAALRFYTWPTPTLTLGYFQPAAVRQSVPGLAELPWTRRASGGAALVHDRELTYALALPPGELWQPRGVSWTCRMHYLIRDTLATWGIDSRLCGCGQERKLGEGLCFLNQTPGDLLIGGHKVVGSAQRRLRGATLQHGGILLAQSPITPQLPGIRELTGVTIDPAELAQHLTEALVQTTGAVLGEPGQWTSDAEAAIAHIRSQRYADAKWNLHR
jgi:lipoate-protein ligase A